MVKAAAIQDVLVTWYQASIFMSCEWVGSLYDMNGSLYKM